MVSSTGETPSNNRREESAMTQASGDPKRRQQTAPERAHHATQRCRQQARDHLQRAQARAPHHRQALEQALVDWGRPETLAVEGEWRLKTLGKQLGNIVGVMCPTWFGCRTADELTRGRGWDKPRPGTVLRALPPQTWVRPRPHPRLRGQALLATLWQPGADKRPATRSRWPWTGGG